LRAGRPIFSAQTCPGRAVAAWLAGAFLLSSFACATNAGPTSCLIDRTVYPAGAPDPENPCQSCQPAVDAYGWSAIQSCDAGPMVTDAGSDAGVPPDAGADAGLTDAGPDAGIDAGVDAGSDGGPDAGPGSDDAGTGPGDAGVCFGGGVAYPLLSCCQTAANPGVWTPRLQLATTLLLPPGTLPTLIGANLDGDGWTDLAYTDAAGAVLGIFRNLASGSFQPLATYPTDIEPQGLAAGDLDGDGHLDLVVASATSATLGVFMGAGDGTFAGQVSYAAGTGPAFVAIADFDGDGVPDVVVGQLGTLALFHGIGDGGLGPGVSLSAGGNPHGLLTADFRGDGHRDLAAAVGTSVAILLGYGDGGFSLSTTGSSDSQSHYLAVGDWNRDGRVDLAATYQDPDAGLAILLGGGDGTFAPALVAAGLVLNPSFVDLDGDGATDLVFACGKALCALWQSPDGGVSPTVPLAAATGLNSPVVVADFNHDGAPDVAAYDSVQKGIRIYLNACP